MTTVVILQITTVVLINHSTSYNLNNTELNDLLNLITYITLTNK